MTTPISAHRSTFRACTRPSLPLVAILPCVFSPLTPFATHSSRNPAPTLARGGDPREVGGEPGLLRRWSPLGGTLMRVVAADAPEVREDLVDDGNVLDHGDGLHLDLAPGAEQGFDLEDPPNEPGPAAAARRRLR